MVRIGNSLIATYFCVGIVIVSCAIPENAKGGAWTLPEGKAQIIVTTTLSNAERSFDASGAPTDSVSFQKLFVSAYSEYGLNDWLTLVATPEFASATSAVPGLLIQKADDFAISGGARARVLNSDFGVFSVQAGARSAGAFELDTSANEQPGKEIELRILFGKNFEIFGRQAALDAEIAHRWTTGGRPNEIPIDLTLIYDVGWDSRIFFQNFNVIAEGDGKPPFSYYRYHKFALSIVRPLWGPFSVQAGGFFSPAGQNALQERGFFSGVWVEF